MAGVYDSCAKRKYKTLFQRFRDEFSEIKRLEESFHNVCNSIDNPLVVLEITSCNGAAGYGVEFSSASCETLPYTDEVFPFGSIFQPGVLLLKKFFEDDEFIPEDNASLELLSILFNYLMDTSSHDVLKTLVDPDFANTEAKVEIVLARHLLAKLSTSTDYTFDHNSNLPEQCACGSCRENMRRYIDDTSIGNSKCWHGSLDIVFGGIDLFASLVKPDKEDRDDSSEDTAPVEYGSVDELGSRSRILAELITFSFLQRKRRQETMPHCWTPCVAITREEVKFFFYDSQNDILMESRDHRIVYKEKINLEAIISLWLVLNYKHTCSGPTSTIVQAPKAKFFSLAEKCIDIYRNEMKFRSVSKYSSFELIDYRYLAKSKPKFVWPADQEPFD